MLGAMHTTLHTWRGIHRAHAYIQDAMQREELKWLAKTASSTLDSAQGVLDDLSQGVSQLGKQLGGNFGNRTVRCCV